jgi:ribosomal protein L16 Arg81 hydroxylase
LVSSFNFCISPIKESLFFEDFWEKKPLHIKRRNKDYFSELLTLDMIDDYLTTKGLQYPEFQIVKDGKTLTPTLKDFQNEHSSRSRFADITSLLDHYSIGATIIFLALERHLKSVSSLCLGLQAHLNIPTQANVYLTPRTSKGFKAHFDTHEVFILQVEGKKRWKIWDSEIDLPLKHQQYLFEDSQENKPPNMDITLEKGDTL